MELFYSNVINGGLCTLDEQETRHCANVLRHKVGDTINVIDGIGNMYYCQIESISKKETVCKVLEINNNFGAHNYILTMAVCPTKNIDRYEWFLEKATEIGLDVVVPIIGEHSERKIIKHERCERVLVSAAKQSIKAKFPVLREQISVIDFIKEAHDGLKLIAFCEDERKISLPFAIKEYVKNCKDVFPSVTILIGPEGDFSKKEINLALENGFLPIHLGDSRLRTETAALAAVSCVYFMIQK